MTNTKVIFQEPTLGYLPKTPTLTLTSQGNDAPVVIFSEMFGVLGTGQFEPQESAGHTYHCYEKTTIELTNNNTISLFHSPELIADITTLIATGVADWKWLSNLEKDVHRVAEAIDLPGSLEDVPLIKDITSTYDGTSNPKGASIMNEYLNKGETRPFVWLTPHADSLYYHPELLATLAVPYIVVNPNPKRGVSSSNWKEILRFLTENSTG